MKDQVVGLVRNLSRVCDVLANERGPEGVHTLERTLAEIREAAAPGELYFVPVWKPRVTEPEVQKRTA